MREVYVHWSLPGANVCVRLLAMIRAFLTVAALAPMLAMADLKSDFQKKYSELDQFLATKKVDAAERWLDQNAAKGFTYTSRDKNTYDLPKFKQGIRDQIAATKKVKETATKVISVKQTGDKVIVVTDSHTTASMVFDTKPMKLIDKSQAKDTWVKIGGLWKLKTSIQTGGSTQMYQEEA